jgi:hypothetical protein
MHAFHHLVFHIEPLISNMLRASHTVYIIPLDTEMVSAGITLVERIYRIQTSGRGPRSRWIFSSCFCIGITLPKSSFNVPEDSTDGSCEARVPGVSRQKGSSTVPKCDGEADQQEEILKSRLITAPAPVSLEASCTVQGCRDLEVNQVR